MNGSPAPRPAAPSGPLGVLRAWLLGRSGEVGPASEVLASGNVETQASYNGSVRVLVVDDNPVNLMVISGLLASRDVVPMLAADGAEAVALACELDFDLILMDLQMPVLDGLKATSAIRSFEAEASRPAVPVVAYSGSAPGADILAAYGLSGSLNKPCEDQELEDCLVRWCHAYRPLPALGAVTHRDRSGELMSSPPGPDRAWLR